MFRGKFLKLGHARHRAVFIHDLAYHGCRLEAGELCEIYATLGLTRARQDAA